MRIVVCIKQVPSTNEVRIDPETNTIMRDGRQAVTNPFDTFAIEQAIQIKEQLKGEVIGLSMGIPATEKLLRDAISRGIDRALLLTDRKFAGADTLATSYTLSLGVKELGNIDLIMCGKMAVDGDTAQIGPELAEHLNIPHVTDVCELIDITEQKIVCKKVTDYGHQIVEVKLPALLTVLKDINLPRLPSIPGVMHSLNADVKVMGVEDVKADISKIGLSGSPTQVVKTFTPKRQNEALQIDGDTNSKAKKVLEIIKGVL